MSARAEALAERFERANQEVLGLVSTCPAEQMAAICPAEGWTAAALGSHIAYSYKGMLDNLIKPIVAGEHVAPRGQEAFAEMNARHAVESAAMPREQVVGLLQGLGQQTAEYLRSLSDEDLDRSTTFPSMDRPVSVEQLVDMVLIGHTKEHGQSLREGLA